MSISFRAGRRTRKSRNGDATAANFGGFGAWGIHGFPHVNNAIYLLKCQVIIFVVVNSHLSRVFDLRWPVAVRCPRLAPCFPRSHKTPPLFQRVAPPISLSALSPTTVRERRLGQFARIAGFVSGPVAKGAPKAVDSRAAHAEADYSFCHRDM